MTENRIFENRQQLKIALFRDFSLKKQWFFALKRSVLLTRNVGIIIKKLRFLKQILIFV